MNCLRVFRAITLTGRYHTTHAYDTLVPKMGTHKTTDLATCAIVDVSSFIQATRDSGYKTTTSALSELIDNAIETEASHINIQVDEDPVPHQYPNSDMAFTLLLLRK